MKLNKEICKQCWLKFLGDKITKTYVLGHNWWNDPNRFRCWKLNGVEVGSADELFDKAECNYELEHTVNND